MKKENTALQVVLHFNQVVVKIENGIDRSRVQWNKHKYTVKKQKKQVKKHSQDCQKVAVKLQQVEEKEASSHPEETTTGVLRSVPGVRLSVQETSPSAQIQPSLQDSNVWKPLD